MPPCLIIELQPDNVNWRDLDLINSIEFILPTTTTCYVLTGIIYLGSQHFTCRYRDTEGHWWYHDGISANRYMSLDNITSLHCVADRQACLLIYSQKLI